LDIDYFLFKTSSYVISVVFYTIGRQTPIQSKVDQQTGEVIDQSTLDHLSGQLTAFGDYIQRVKP